MERVALVIASIATPALVACQPALGTCAHEDNLVARDGGLFTCIKSEDCPRPSNVTICVTHNDPRVCVECVDTRCVSRAPADCGATP